MVRQMYLCGLCWEFGELRGFTNKPEFWEHHIKDHKRNKNTITYPELIRLITSDILNIAIVKEEGILEVWFMSLLDEMDGILSGQILMTDDDLNRAKKEIINEIDEQIKATPHLKKKLIAIKERVKGI